MATQEYNDLTPETSIDDTDTIMFKKTVGGTFHTITKQNAFSSLQSQITSNDSDITGLLSADTALQNNIDAEASSRASADTGLQSQITTNTGNIATNVAAIAALVLTDASLQSQITANVAAILGKAETVHTHTKSQITDFAHTHLKAEITDFAHTHLKADITDFAHTHTESEITDLGNYAVVGHTHAQADITGLVTALAGKSAVGHGHNLSEITIDQDLAMGANSITTINLTATGQMLAADGTTALPAYSFSSDIDTGVRLNGPNVGELVAGGIQSMRWTTSDIRPNKIEMGNGDIAAVKNIMVGNASAVGLSGSGVFTAKIAVAPSTNVPGQFQIWAADINGVDLTTGMVLRTEDARTFTFGKAGGIEIGSGVAEDVDLIQVNEGTAFASRPRMFWDESSNAFSIGGGANFHVNALTVFQNMTMSNTKNFILSNATGSMMGTAADQKFALWGVPPIAQPTALTAADVNVPNSGDATTDAIIANLQTRNQELETKLQALGAIA